MGVYDTIQRIENDTHRVNFEKGQKSLGADKLDKHAFLQLMMAQLKHQDPMNPLKDNEFLSQQAQLAQVEKLDELLTIWQGNALLSQASALVGKRVDIRTADNQVVSGMIDSAAFSNGTAAIQVNGQNFTLNQITKIYGS